MENNMELLGCMSPRVKREFDIRDFNFIETERDIKAQKLYMMRDNLRMFAAYEQDSQVLLSEFQERRHLVAVKLFRETPQVTFEKTLKHTYLHYFGKLVLCLLNFKETSGITESLEDPTFEETCAEGYLKDLDLFSDINNMIAGIPVTTSKEDLHAYLVECMNLLRRAACEFKVDIFGVAELTFAYMMDGRRGWERM